MSLKTSNRPETHPYPFLQVSGDPTIVDFLGGIIAEYSRAERKWGTEFDDKNTANDWVHYINWYASGAAPLEFDEKHFRTNMLKIAGLCLSALKALDRNGSFPPRHYDGGK